MPIAAPAYVGTPGTHGNTASGAGLIVTTTSIVPVGHHLILIVAHSTSNTVATTYTVAGSTGNAWTKDYDFEVIGGRGLAVFSAPITTQIPAGGTVTATASQTLKQAGVLIEVDQLLTYDAAGVTSVTSGGLGETPSVAAAGPLGFLVGVLSAVGADVVTRDPAWTAGPAAVSTISAPDIGATTVVGSLTAAGTYSTAFTYTPAGTSTAAAVAYKAVAAPGAVPDDIYQLSTGGVWTPVVGVYQLSSGGVWT